MASCEFSEFSFGYALTHSLTTALGPALGGAPIFPSLIQEGSAGGGYDVKLPLLPYPIFLQFKIPIVLTRHSSLKPTSYSVPYYRIYLRSRFPNQHQLLLDLETSESLVLYAAPLFHELIALDSHFTARLVHEKCTFVRPSQIGALTPVSHHLAYKEGESTYWLRSEPTPIEGTFSFEELRKRIIQRREAERDKWHAHQRHIDDGEANDRRRDVMLKLRTMFVLLESKFAERKGRLPIESDATRDIYRIDNLAPPEMARRLAYLAQVRFDVTLAFGEAANVGKQGSSKDGA